MNDKREQKKEVNIKDVEGALEYLLKESQRYFGIGEDSDKYKTPPTRYETWMMASALSNIILIDKIKELINLMKKKGK